MDVALTNLESVLERGQKEQLLPVQVLDELLQRELAGRMQRRIQANFKFSGLPVVQRIEQFDFEAQPQLPRPTVEELATLRFMASAENVVFLGPCGVGKTHLATGLAVRALEEGHKAYFLTLHDLVSRARLARRRDQLHLLLGPTEAWRPALDTHRVGCVLTAQVDGYQLQPALHGCVGIVRSPG